MPNHGHRVLFAERILAAPSSTGCINIDTRCARTRYIVQTDSAVPEDSHDELFTERILATPSLIDPVCTTSKIVPTERETVGTASTNATIVTIAGWMVGRWGRSPPHLPSVDGLRWMTRIVTQYIASNVWRRVAASLSSFFTARAGSTTLETKWRASRRKREERVSGRCNGSISRCQVRIVGRLIFVDA